MVKRIPRKRKGRVGGMIGNGVALDEDPVVEELPQLSWHGTGLLLRRFMEGSRDPGF
jgi:hypothetical protein